MRLLRRHSAAPARRQTAPFPAGTVYSRVQPAPSEAKMAAGAGPGARGRRQAWRQRLEHIQQAAARGSHRSASLSPSRPRPRPRRSAHTLRREVLWPKGHRGETRNSEMLRDAPKFTRLHLAGLQTVCKPRRPGLKY